MSTRCMICAELENGVIRGIYCHHDGYIEGGVGDILLRHYQEKTKILALLDGGDISSLGASIEKPSNHNYITPVPGYTVFYRRDRGLEDDEEDGYYPLDYLNFADLELTECGEFDYMYVFSNGRWLYWTPQIKTWEVLR